jgi:hypothetical protein
MYGGTLLGLLLIGVWSNGAFCQGNSLEIVKEPVIAQHLDGFVRLYSGGQGVAGVHVEECDEGWKSALASTMTDMNGHFHLTAKGRRSIRHIRIYARGFNIREYTVRLSRKAHPELQLVITVGT